MQIDLTNNTHADGAKCLCEYLESEVRFELGGLADQVTRIHAQLTDARFDEVACRLELRRAGHARIVVRVRARTADLAIHGAVDKLRCLLEPHDAWQVRQQQTAPRLRTPATQAGERHAPA